MANTTDVIITTLFDNEAIEYIKKKTELPFRQITDGEKCGGWSVVSFEVFGICVRSLERKKIDELIGAFKAAPWTAPEYAIMIIDDDSGAYHGVVKFDAEQKIT